MSMTNPVANEVYADRLEIARQWNERVAKAGGSSDRPRPMASGGSKVVS